MVNHRAKSIDVAVIGAGPAGITACSELLRIPKLRITLFESDSELGGMPRSCHYFFGIRDRKRVYTGPTYARKLAESVDKTSIEIQKNTTVLDLIPSQSDGLHRLNIISPDGPDSYESRFVVLATGCFESSRASRGIGGERPAGVLTTGALQQIVNLQRLRPGRRALIVGSEHVAFSSLITLRKAGVEIAGMVELETKLNTYRPVEKAVRLLYGVPVYRGFSLNAILGNSRVVGVELANQENGKVIQIECDTVVITGRFLPETGFLDRSGVEIDYSTSGPFVDGNLMTSIPNIFAAGNILRGADMHDLCALEGRIVAQSIIRRMRYGEERTKDAILLKAIRPIRYVVPQKVTLEKAKTSRFGHFFPGFAIQLDHTIDKPILEAWSGNEKIWTASYSRLLGYSRVPLPVRRFRWSRVNPVEGLTLRLKVS